MLPINFAIIYIFIVISIIYLIWNFAKNKKIDWVLSYFTILMVANIFTLIVGAPFESQRLFFTSIVSVLLLIGYSIKKIETNKYENNKK